jgi:hypothetical protein
MSNEVLGVWTDGLISAVCQRCITAWRVAGFLKVVWMLEGCCKDIAGAAMQKDFTINGILS